MVEEECLGKGGELLLWSACAAVSRICWVFILHSTFASKNKNEIGFINGLNHLFSQKCFQATIVSEVSVCAA